MSKILLSVNPEHVNHILDGSKKYEYRKQKCRENVNSILIYATSPVKKVVAEVSVEMIIEGSPNAVWSQTKNRSGISDEFYFKYFEGRKHAVAYKLSDIRKFDVPKELVDYGVITAPQSFVYVRG